VKDASVVLVAREDELRRAADRLGRASRIAVDVESNGLFKYRASLCTIQLATADEVVVVDALGPPLGALAGLLGPSGPRKIVHDVAFDARILADAALPLGNVFDTSLAARMLGRPATGLASLLAGELGITLDKRLQHHDWTERPIRDSQLQYLADDVAHLTALADRLGAEIAARATETAQPVAEAIEEETRYRLAQAAAAGSVDPRPPYVRLKGIDRVPREELSILRRVAGVREQRAQELDVPPYKVLGPDVLFAIAKARPCTLAELERVKGATDGSRARSIARAMLEAVAAGVADGGAVPDADRAMLERPRFPASVVKARREREGRLTAWRRAEAKRRGVDEQVVLPGHCLQDLADLAAPTPEAVASTPGIGAFRAERDGAAIVRALSGEAPPPSDEAGR
jgi:ribonuclease D